MTVTDMKKLFARNMMMREKEMEGLFNLPKASYTDKNYLVSVVSAFRRVFRNNRSDAKLMNSYDPIYEYLTEQDLNGFYYDPNYDYHGEQDLRIFDSDSAGTTSESDTA